MREWDSFDIKLLALLQEDALLTAEELSREVSLSPSAIARRVRRMRENGTIVADRSVVTEEIGPFLTALVEVQLSSHAIAGVEEILGLLASRDEVQAILEVAGAFDLVLAVATRGMDDFNDFADQMLGSNPAVLRYETRFVKKRRKFVSAWPL